MKGIFKHIEGDRTIWALVAILALFSFMPVYSASANLVSVVGGSTLGYLLKHVVLLIMGFAIIYASHFFYMFSCFTRKTNSISFKSFFSKG